MYSSSRPWEVAIGIDLNILSINYISNDIGTDLTPIIQYKNYYNNNNNYYANNYADIIPLINTDIMLQNKMSIIKVAWMIAVYREIENKKLLIKNKLILKIKFDSASHKLKKFNLDISKIYLDILNKIK